MKMKFDELDIRRVDNGFEVRNKQSGRDPYTIVRVYEFGSEVELVRYLAECVKVCTTEVEYEDDVSSEQEIES